MFDWFKGKDKEPTNVLPFPELKEVSEFDTYHEIKEQCKKLMNINYTKTLDNDSLVRQYEDMKEWLLETLTKCCTF